MSGFTLPVNRTSGRAIVVGSATSRAFPLSVLGQLGYQSLEADDPYSAMSGLCQRPLAYRAMVLCLGGLYREELQIVAAIKRRFPHVEIWLAQVDGRAAALADASRLGADGLVSEEGLHRFAASSPAAQQVVNPVAPPAATAPPVSPPADIPQPAAASATSRTSSSPIRQERISLEMQNNDPVLTADELRALLQEHPSRSEEVLEET